ncbi:hypothetical protein FRACA_440014 [Frankia canadensis]|uniref:Uncharacterized protein n=1 Tax=Frankia canadensis TaxID=1836972 RepID=A0A2I2KXD1_9ACTN|nr:hypothetical protein FRACA_440014 [Frankia canadensis]SOU57607.1 hypothetical protein FRACA_440014 [Frankia canadensis]
MVEGTEQPDGEPAAEDPAVAEVRVRTGGGVAHGVGEPLVQAGPLGIREPLVELAQQAVLGSRVLGEQGREVPAQAGDAVRRMVEVTLHVLLDAAHHRRAAPGQPAEFGDPRPAAGHRSGELRVDDGLHRAEVGGDGGDRGVAGVQGLPWIARRGVRRAGRVTVLTGQLHEVTGVLVRRVHQSRQGLNHDHLTGMTPDIYAGSPTRPRYAFDIKIALWNQLHRVMISRPTVRDVRRDVYRERGFDYDCPHGCQ